MKTNFLKYTPALLVAMFASNNAIATPTYFYGGGGIESQWAETSLGSGILSYDASNSVAISTIMAGNAAAPGGNVQLETATSGVASLTGSVKTLTTTFDNGSVLTLSSLTAADWTTGGLLDIWAQAYRTAYAPSFTLAAIEAGITPSFELSQSNPYISYANLVNGTVSIGLAGYQNVPGFPTGTQFSKIVKATYNGTTQYLFSMGGSSATASGVHASGSSTIFAENYQVTIPEPSSLALLFVGLTGFLGLRRKAVTA